MGRFERKRKEQFAFALVYDWRLKLTPFFDPIRNQIKANRSSRARVFPRLALG